MKSQSIYLKRSKPVLFPCKLQTAVPEEGGYGNKGQSISLYLLSEYPIIK
jgi:hypothetical protein